MLRWNDLNNFVKKDISIRFRMLRDQALRSAILGGKMIVLTIIFHQK